MLLVLWENDLQTVNEIGNCLVLESNTLPPLLKRLEQKKLIKRTRKKKMNAL
ncbi:MarR family transcriptional regulator [Leeuwenhoekiella polynyae]|uniref:MarR family transcriptional regulator n=1 Tax=Leeuwenhoekiella polynyae TaxID=1550906 RepID=UPI0021CE2D92|nr:MarR family transcriptional regulator [Leeuwenhoekiella polynyae]